MARSDLRSWGPSPKDRKLWGEFYKIARGVWAGSIDLGPVVDAYQQAMKPRIANQGAKLARE